MSSSRDSKKPKRLNQWLQETFNFLFTVTFGNSILKLLSRLSTCECSKTYLQESNKYTSLCVEILIVSTVNNIL